MSQENEAVVRRLVDEVWNGGRVEAIEELVSPEYVLHDPALPQVAHGPSGLADNVRLYRHAFPDINLEIEELVSTDDTVTMRWRATGTHRGELMGVQPTGRRSAVTGIGFLRLRDGKLVQEYQEWDQAAMLRQLGLLPERDSAQERAMRGLANLRTKVTQALGR